VDKTTLYLDPADYRKLKRIAAEKGQTPAAMVREAVAEYVVRHGRPALPVSVGAFGSGRGDVAERAEELLDGFGEPAGGNAETAAPRRRGRNARDRR
jgi:predicted transcriptional regulator